MKALLTIVAAIAFIATFVLCESHIILAFVSFTIFGVCAKIVEKYYLTNEEKEERV